MKKKIAILVVVLVISFLCGKFYVERNSKQLKSMEIHKINSVYKDYNKDDLVKSALSLNKSIDAGDPDLFIPFENKEFFSEFLTDKEEYAKEFKNILKHKDEIKSIGRYLYNLFDYALSFDETISFKFNDLNLTIPF
ncbi:MAG: hypothetical protein MSH08_03870 [Ezakiella sp.]|nr:hypothetical protein [Ezakiella sp.]MDD7471659.1 hypothetical protein [Bacillota bacterium]MDY3923443.1 hypothetical protein [Ezakiella sp.]